MKTLVQIVGGVVHWKFQCDVMPNLGPGVVLVDVTDTAPQPREGWIYEEDGTFVAAHQGMRVDPELQLVLDAMPETLQILTMAGTS
ncbi:hypothetical protein [Achromobacter sp. UMC71]|uniref:hypothetical protein n=1 Tax=Achromobacter sp. UMC71 TaxID=1862320 RepID=UPI0016039E7D|nr:hypothetical protein [Achromobacter sp. UMC71]MBB1625185.1 hypothetical protein [Achromobacter sp. UMC71]